MLRFLADENFNGDIVRGLLRHAPDLDLVRVQDVGLSGSDDPELLRWAAEKDRIILSHDRATMAECAFQRIESGAILGGVFLLDVRLPVGKAIEELLLIATCTDQSEWRGLVAYLPI